VLPLLTSACTNLTISLMQLLSPRVYQEATTEPLTLTFLVRFPRLVDVELTHMIFFLGYGLRFFSYRFPLLAGLVHHLDIGSSLMEG
jgi:hypothetical protein